MGDVAIPKAVASGPTVPELVRPIRTGVGAGVLAALFLGVVYLGHPVPLRLVAMFGGGSTGIERDGGLEMTWQAPPGQDLAAIERSFASRSTSSRVDRVEAAGDLLQIRVPGVRPDEVAWTARSISGEGGLAFHEVMQVEEMQTLAQVLQLPMKSARPIDVEIDQWRSDSGETRTDYYLFGETRKDIDTALAEAASRGWKLPAGTHIALEAVVNRDRTKSGVRTYVLRDTVELDGDSIANAVASQDPNTGRAIVLLDFDRVGARTFGDLTERLVGKKLAIVLGDDVQSAPVINDRIRGGRASITMGVSTPTQEEHDARALVNSLRTGSLPRGGTVVSTRYIAPIDDAPMVWLARGTIAVGGGGLIGLLVWMVVRLTRPVRRRGPARADGSVPWSRIAVTLLAPLAIYVLGKITVAGINADELTYRVGPHSRSLVSIGALGIGPVLTTFALVEIVAVIIPSWRRRRLAGPAARWPIELAAWMLAGLLIVIQGWFITLYLSSLGDVLPFGLMPRVLVIGSLALGTLILVAVAALVREHGLGNGVAIVFASGWLIQAGHRVLAEPRMADNVIGLATAFAVAVPVAVTLRWRIARVGEVPLRVPTSGIAPLGDAGGLAMIAGLTGILQLDNVTVQLATWIGEVHARQWLVIALVAAMTGVWSYAFARPRGLARIAERTGLAVPTWSSWSSATGLSAALQLLLGAAVLTAAALRPGASVLADAILISMLCAIVLDVLDDLRGRRVALERVWSLHQPQHADLVVRVLAESGIPCHLASANLRTLLAFFGPFAPIDVLVAHEHAPETRQRLRQLFEQ